MFYLKQFKKQFEAQQQQILRSISSLTMDDIQEIIFSENDILDKIQAIKPGSYTHYKCRDMQNDFIFKIYDFYFAEE